MDTEKKRLHWQLKKRSRLFQGTFPFLMRAVFIRENPYYYYEVYIAPTATMSGSGIKRSYDDYVLCPHCEKEFSSKRFKEHERLYFNQDSKVWVKEIEKPDDDGDDSSMSNFDEFEVLDNHDLGDDNDDNWDMEDTEVSYDTCESLETHHLHKHSDNQGRV